MTFSQNWGYILLQGWLWPFLSSGLSTWQSIHDVLVSSVFYAIADVLSLENIGLRLDVGSCLAIDVCFIRNKWRQVKQKCHATSECQSCVVLLFGRKVISGSQYGSVCSLPAVKLFHGCEQASYVAYRRTLGDLSASPLCLGISRNRKLRLSTYLCLFILCDCAADWFLLHCWS